MKIVLKGKEAEEYIESINNNKKEATSRYLIPEYDSIDFKKMRMELKLSQTEVGEAIGLDSSYLSRIESRANDSSYKSVARLYNYYIKYDDI